MNKVGLLITYLYRVLILCLWLSVYKLVNENMFVAQCVQTGQGKYVCGSVRVQPGQRKYVCGSVFTNWSKKICLWLSV